ncbi:rI lysis inhibition regulator membrane protein [Providencia phage PSTRCR_121]|nr:rI lysis inhibition regulator membrane protein [Providencia phage PSTRCR_121]
MSPKLLIGGLLCAICLSSFAKTSDTEFNEYVEGALVVYAQIKEPSKEESERFYNFVKKKWADVNCESSTCLADGERIGREYVYIQQKELINE